MPTRPTLSPYAGPMPRPVVPIRADPRYRSTTRSSARWCGITRCASAEMSSRSHVTSRVGQSVDLAQQHLGVDHDTVADHRGAAGREHAGRQQVEGELPPVREDHGVAGVVAALVPHDVVDLLAEQIGDLALALVAPLGPDEHDRWHSWPPKGRAPSPGCQANNEDSEGGSNVPDVVILTLRDSRHGTGEGCVCGRNDEGCADERPRVPVLECADALRDEGRSVELVTARDESEIDAATRRSTVDLAVVAAATDAELRAVVRRLVRRHAPPPSKRPAELPAEPDHLRPAAAGRPAALARGAGSGHPARPAARRRRCRVGRTGRRKFAGYDLLRTDSGSVTLGGALLGGVADGGLVSWRGRVEVDDVGADRRRGAGPRLRDPQRRIVRCGRTAAGHRRRAGRRSGRGRGRGTADETAAVAGGGRSRTRCAGPGDGR